MRCTFRNFRKDLSGLNIKIKKGFIKGSKLYSGAIQFDSVHPFYDEKTEKDGVTFILGDEAQAAVWGDLIFTSPVRASGKLYKIASVYFSPGGRHYDYLLDIDGVEVGNTVIIMTDRGKTEVTVADISEKAESELALPIGKYKKILEKV